MSVVSAIANRCYRLASRSAHKKLLQSMHEPAVAQQTVLSEILGGIESTNFGNEHQLSSPMNPESFRDAVPLRTYDDFVPYIERLAAGEAKVLTVEAVKFFEPTAGSSGASKLIPYTDGLLREFGNATSAWVHDMLTHNKRLRNGRAYWAVSPPTPPTTTSGGIPVGQAHDSDYFPRMLAWLLDSVVGLPRAVSKVTDIETCRALTLRALIGMNDLTMISVWSPTFLTLLADRLTEDFSTILSDVEFGRLSMDLPKGLEAEIMSAFPARPSRVRELRKRFGTQCPQDLGELWQDLALISCWCDGHAQRVLSPMRERFPTIPIQPKGLLSTEAVTSIPLSGQVAPVAALNSHLLEFLPEGNDNSPMWVHELQRGKRYEVVVTTSGGLYRCRTRDIVEVVGFAQRAPLLRFVGRGDGTSDLAGEKLTPAFVELTIDRACSASNQSPTFAMLVACPDEFGTGGIAGKYILVVDGVDDALALEAAIERELQANHHYKLCRELGQLGEAHVRIVPGAEIIDAIACETLGQRAGTIKPRALETRAEIAKAFALSVED